MADPSFDVVSKVDRQEVDNALNQAAKEIGTRFDFKGVDASIAWSGEDILVKASTEERCKAALEVFKEKVVKRAISLKSLDHGDPQPSGKEFRLTVKVQQGIATDKAKELVKLVKAEGPKGIQASIQGETVRISGKKKDDLQEVISLLKGADLGISLQFENYR